MYEFFLLRLKSLLAGFLSLNTLSYVLLVVLVLLLEVAALGYQKSSISRLLAPSASAWNDIVSEGIRIVGLARPMFMVAALGLPFLVSGAYREYVHWDLLGSVTNPYFAYALWFVAYDFLAYWTHRWSHSLVPWWQVHKYHHAATEFNVVTGNRVHFLDDAASELCRVLPLLLLGLPAEWFVSFWAIRVVIDLWQHSAVGWNYGWIGRWVIFSPVGHRQHHSMEAEHWDKNFGNIFVWWDRMFGTWYAGSRVNDRVGVLDSQYNTGSALKDLWLGVELCARSLWVSLGAGARPRTAGPGASSPGSAE